MLISIRTINDNMIQQLGHPHTDQFFQDNTDSLLRSWHEKVTDKADNWMIQEVRMPECRQLLAEMICRGNVVGVSNDSFCPQARKGSSAAVIQCQAADLVPGHPRNQSSHRSKLAGILAMVKLLQILHEEHDLTNG